MKHRFIVMLLPIIWVSIACGGGRRSAEEKSSEISGEQYGNYCAEWCLKDSKGRAGKELWLDVSYKGKKIFQKAVSHKDFPDIDSPEQYILAEPRSAHADNDILVIPTDMTIPDTDCGYDVEILISPDGQMRLRYIDIDSYLAFSDMIEDIRNDYPGENLCDLVLRMDFYNEAESSAEEYAALYAFYLYNTYEYAWEGVGGYLYDMFIRYPDKFEELHMTLAYLPDDQRETILDRLTYSLIFECKASADASSQPSFEHFASMFPYLDTPQVEKFFESVNPY
jgi:hypothetical protein